MLSWTCFLVYGSLSKAVIFHVQQLRLLWLDGCWCMPRLVLSENFAFLHNVVFCMNGKCAFTRCLDGLYFNTGEDNICFGTVRTSSFCQWTYSSRALTLLDHVHHEERRAFSLFLSLIRQGLVRIHYSRLCYVSIFSSTQAFLCAFPSSLHQWNKIYH